MEKTDILRILNIEELQEEAQVKAAYREILSRTNPEENPEGFKELRQAYEEAIKLLKEPATIKETDNSPSGRWIAKAGELYADFSRRRDIAAWENLFGEDIFSSLEEEENCRHKFFVFIMEHFRYPSEVWKLFDKYLGIKRDVNHLLEQYPRDFVGFLLNRCDHGEDLNYNSFSGPDDADYDNYIRIYENCWRAMDREEYEEADQLLTQLEGSEIRHPIAGVCRAEYLLAKEDMFGAVKVMNDLLSEYPEDDTVVFNAAEKMWQVGYSKEMEELKDRAASLFETLKTRNDEHYTANLRLSRYYFDKKRYKEAKKCAEKVLRHGAEEDFTKLLEDINSELEKSLETEWYENGSAQSGLDLCWCYLQDFSPVKALTLARSLEGKLPAEKDSEYKGLLTKINIEAGNFEKISELADIWEEALHRRLSVLDDAYENERDEDRINQSHLIRMQAFHAMGYINSEYFVKAIEEGRKALTNSYRDINPLVEMGMLYIELEQYDEAEDVARKLLEMYHVDVAHSILIEIGRRTLDASLVVRSGMECINSFPAFEKPYEYMAKVYLDLQRPEDFAKLYETAKANDIKSCILDAYAFQMENGRGELTDEEIQKKIDAFRQEYRKRLDRGDLSKYEEGLAALTDIINICPDSYMMVELGHYCKAARKFEEAKKAYDKAITLSPSNCFAFNGLAMLHRLEGKDEMAAQYLKRAILYRRDDMTPVIYSDLGDLYHRMGAYEDELEACETFEKLSEDRSVWYLSQKAECLMGLGRIEEADELLKSYAEKNPGKSFLDRTNMYLEKRMQVPAKKVLEEWSEYLGITEKKGAFTKLFNKDMPRTDKQIEERLTYYLQKIFYDMAYSSKEDILADVKAMLATTGKWSAFKHELTICIIAGICIRNKSMAEACSKILRSVMAEDEKADLAENKDSMKFWYDMKFYADFMTEDIKTLRAFLDEEYTKCPNCGHCNNCACEENEIAQVILLEREGKTEEAKALCEKSLKRRRVSSVMIGVKRLLFEQ